MTPEMKKEIIKLIHKEGIKLIRAEIANVFSRSLVQIKKFSLKNIT